MIVLSPYLIFYHFERSATQVEILRFWHGARDPFSLQLTWLAEVSQAVVSRPACHVVVPRPREVDGVAPRLRNEGGSPANYSVTISIFLSVDSHR